MELQQQHLQNKEQTDTINFINPLSFIDYNKELDIEIKSSKPLTGKQYLLLIPITKFFKKYRNIYLLINILNGRSIISLRLIEYFVVNYVLENNTYYNLTKYKNNPEYIVNNLFTTGPPTIDITTESMNPVKNLENTGSASICTDDSTVCNGIESSPISVSGTVCTGLQAPNVNSTATGVTPNLRPPGMGLEFSVSGMPVQAIQKSLKDEIRMSIENKIKKDTVCTGIESPTQFNATGVTLNSRSQISPRDKMGLDFSVGGTTNNFDDYFLVHDNYKCQLKEYNKKNFDPFCRWTRIRIYYHKTKYFYTTVAQLNFFKWAIENYVLDYILDNLVTIEKAMNDYERAIKKEKKIRKLNMLQSTNSICTGIESISQSNTPLSTYKISSGGRESSVGGPVCAGIESPAKCNASTSPNSIPLTLNSKPAQTVPLTLKGDNSMPVQTVGCKELDIDINTIPDSIISSQLQQQLGPSSINTGKKITHNLFSTLDKKSKLKGRKKKEFTKTNRSILKYTCTKIVNFD